MSELVFRENDDKYDGKIIEAGHWEERDDGSKFFSTILDIDLINQEVRTDCGDTYMDYSINFDTFLAIADKVKELKKGERNELAR